MSARDAGSGDPGGRFVRVARFATAIAGITIDGTTVEARQGESVLAAVLVARSHIRRSEFTGEPRAGFCLMGACQDCWVWLGDNSRVRACTTLVSEGMRISTEPPAGFPRHA